MSIFYLIVQLFAHQGEVMVVRKYGRKYGAGGMLFNAIICAFAMIFFLVSDTDGLHFVPGLWVYGLVNALLYGSGFYFVYVAFKSGNYFVTQTITSLNFMIPILYGLLFLKEPANGLTYVSLCFSLFSVLLMCYARQSKAQQSDRDKGISAKWLISTLIVLFSNGLISVVSKMQQIRFDKLHSNEFMIITLAGASVALFFMGVIMERTDMRKMLKQGILYGMGAGMLNGIKNAAHLALIMRVSLSVLTPMSKGAGMLMTFLVSFFIYKERYTKMQYISVALGVVAIVLMQLS